MFDLLVIIGAAGVITYFIYKEGLKRGAARAIDELESSGFINIDKTTGDIKPVHWEYIYPDRKGKKEVFRPKKKKQKEK